MGTSTFKTSINLDEHSQQILRKKLAAGRYQTMSEVVREALQRMDQEDIRQEAELKMLDEAEATGIDPRSHEDIWTDLEAKHNL